MLPKVEDVKNENLVNFNEKSGTVLKLSNRQKSQNIFRTLSRVNVNNKVETKNGLKYLSWAYAWAEAKKRFPDANYRIYETETGVFYFTDGRTCWVKTGVTIGGLEHIEYLPVMDNRNKSIPLKFVTSFDVNKTIQRSLTKALARHGLGLYIFAGEDLPEQTEEEVTTESQAIPKLKNLISSFGKEEAKKYLEAILKKYKISKIEELKSSQAEKLVERLEKTKNLKDGGTNVA